MEEEMLNISEVMRMIRIKSRATLYTMISKGDFPKPVKMSPRTHRWRKEDIDAWMNKKLREMEEEENDA